MYTYVVYAYMCICTLYTDRTQSRVGRRSVRGAFLSSSSRSAPPRDIMLEEPDIMNPGHTHTCVLPSVFVYYMYVIYTMPEKFSTSVLCIVLCMYIFSFIQYIRSGTHFHGFMYNNML